MMEAIFQSWNWYIAGPLIGLFVPLLLLVGNRLFGISSSFEHICTLVLPANKSSILNYDLKNNQWKFYFVIGILIGGFISANFLSREPLILLPDQYYSWIGFLKLFAGGILVGFGTRYANGCTSGHAITGLSLLNKGSLISTTSFFASGMAFTFDVDFILN